MKIIKLNAIGSTNDFLKEMLTESTITETSIAWTLQQTNGRGQRGAQWFSEAGKNLTFSVLMPISFLSIENQFYISMVAAMAVQQTLTSYSDTKFVIKWPNDILAVGEKISGILIENTIKGSKLDYTIIGIGCNINQTQFPGALKATSLTNLTGKNFELEIILNKIWENLEIYLKELKDKGTDSLKEKYLNNLYNYQKPAMYRDLKNQEIFMAKIIDISKEGFLLIEKENGEYHSFGIKEIEFLH